MGIKELKQMHVDLATLIQNAVERFETETGTRVTGIGLNRISVGIGEPPLLNVDVMVEL